MMRLTLAPLADERDIERVVALEAASYPADEAASEAGVRFRQRRAGAFFQVARLQSDPQQLVGFVNGTLSAGEQLAHESMSAHDPRGALLCIHSVVVDGAFRRRGVASAMLRQYVRYVCEQQPQVKRVALIAKAHLVGFYVSCGFSVTKLSPVVHGKDPWLELVLDCDAARQVPLVQVDAFTSEPFQGNPAVVALLTPAQFHCDQAPQWMQRVAIENNLAETAFVSPRSSAADGDGSVVAFDLKWFKPNKEVALCGHATLATAVALLDSGRVLPSQTIHFRTLSGTLVIRFEPAEGASSADTAAGHRVVMEFPVVADFKPLPADQYSLDDITAALGIARAGVVEALLAGTDLLLHVDAASFAALAPDFGRVGKLPVRGVILTTQVAATSDSLRADFRSRFFRAQVGVGEDSVTGSTHCALAPYWSGRLGGRRQLRGYQASPERGGFLHVELPKTQPGRVLIKGEGVVVMRGSLLSSP